jgi:hypothetical protein
MKTKLMALMLVAGGSLFAQTRFSMGVQFGTPGYYAPAPLVAPRFYDGRFYDEYRGGARGYDRDDYRFRESREHEWREHERREHEHDHGFEHRGDFERGFRH